jgi:hypothetical protein
MAMAAEAEERAKLQQQLNEASEFAEAAEAREEAAAIENERMRMLLADATQEVQAASEGSMLY